VHRIVLLILIISAIKLKNCPLLIELSKKVNNHFLDTIYEEKPLIIHALMVRDLSILKVLLKKDADVNNQTADKDTALHLALKMKLDIKFIKLLLDYGAHIHIKNKKGFDAVDLAKDALEEIQNLIVPNPSLSFSC
jgi:ankyrin repeat protein